MDGIDKPHTGKYKAITNDWNYDASCTLTSLPVWDLDNFKRLIFVVQTVHLKSTCWFLCDTLNWHNVEIRQETQHDFAQPLLETDYIHMVM
jgi:hypothetical protein